MGIVCLVDTTPEYKPVFRWLGSVCSPLSWSGWGWMRPPGPCHHCHHPWSANLIGQCLKQILTFYGEKYVWLQDVYSQVLLTRPTAIDKTRLFLKPTNINKNRLVAFHSFTNKKVFSCGQGKCARNARECEWPWFIMSLPTDSCCQLTVANLKKFFFKIWSFLVPL